MLKNFYFLTLIILFFFDNFWNPFFSKSMPIFSVSYSLYSQSTMIFFCVCWFLAKNLTNFDPPSKTFHNLTDSTTYYVFFFFFDKMGFFFQEENSHVANSSVLLPCHQKSNPNKKRVSALTLAILGLSQRRHFSHPTFCKT